MNLRHTIYHSFLTLIVRAERARLIAIEADLLAQVDEETAAINKEKNSLPQSDIIQIHSNGNTLSTVDVNVRENSVDNDFKREFGKIKDVAEMTGEQVLELKANVRKSAHEHVREWVSVLTEPLNEELRVMDEEDDVLLDSWSSHKGVSALSCSTVKNSTVQYSTVQYSTVQTALFPINSSHLCSHMTP